ncbi:MAG: hypothetical protein ABIA37_05460 [Candidatus Woesearchaeota archaeon]
MNKKELAIILVIVFLLGMTATSLFYSHYLVENVMMVEMSLEIGDKLGFDLEKDILNFGRTAPGVSSVTRFMEISNIEDYPIRIKIKTSGELSEWVTASEYNFVLSAGEIKKVDFVAAPPQDAPQGEYSGKVRVLAMKKLF